MDIYQPLFLMLLSCTASLRVKIMPCPICLAVVSARGTPKAEVIRAPMLSSVIWKVTLYEGLLPGKMSW